MPGKILFVDDEQLICEMAHDLFKESPYELIVANSGPAGLKILEKEPVMVVVSDFKMEGMDGIEFLTKVNDTYPDIVRIMITGVAGVEVIIQAINEGKINQILQKPWKTEEFMKAIENAVRRYRNRSTSRSLEEKYMSHTRELETRVEERTRELTLVVDELQKRNEKLETTHQQLIQSDKMASLGLMAGTIAHDISNPLFVIQGNIEILSTRRYLETKDRDLLQSIKGQIRRIESLVQSIRNYSKKSAGTYEKLNLIDAMEEAFLLTRKMVNVKEIEVVTHFPEGIPYIYGNANQIEQVLMNIIQNGVQAMEIEGTLTCEIGHTVKVVDEIEQDFWQVTIMDTGAGIPADKLEVIFDPFFTTKEEGTGLGLNICQRIVNEHGGTIEVYSTLGKGTTFVITFPEYNIAVHEWDKKQKQAMQ